jgi:hypothetical protein
MAHSGFEQYPEYAMMTNDQGERDTRPWVSGPSPLSMGLLTAGLGILAAPERITTWEGGSGGFDPSYIGQGGLLGLQAFQQGHQNLQGQRKDFYTHRNSLMDQVIQNQSAKRQQEEHQRLQQGREKRDESFPELLKMLNNSGRQEYMDAVPILQQLYLTSPEKAVTSAMNIISQLKTIPGEITYVPMTDKNGKSLGSSYLMQDGKYLGTVKHSDSGSGSVPDKLGKSEYDGLLYKYNQEGDTTSPDNYNQIYTGRQRLDATLKDFSDKDKVTTKRYAAALRGVQTPWDKFLTHSDPALRLTPEEMTAKGWKEDPTLLEVVGTSTKPIPVTAQQSAYKVAGITGSEGDMQVLFDEGYDITKMSGKNILTFLAGGWTINPLSGPEFEQARSYESFALKGSMSFAYLFSGATVRAEEMTQFRKSMYPMPGDNPALVESKRRSRKRIIDLYNSMNPSSIRMAHALAKKANGGKLPDLDLNHVNDPEESKLDVEKKAFE